MALGGWMGGLGQGGRVCPAALTSNSIATDGVSAVANWSDGTTGNKFLEYFQDQFLTHRPTATIHSSQPVSQSVSQPVSQSTSQSVSQPVSQSVSQSVIEWHWLHFYGQMY